MGDAAAGAARRSTAAARRSRRGAARAAARGRRRRARRARSAAGRRVGGVRRARRRPAAGRSAVGRAPRAGGDRALRRAVARRLGGAHAPDLVLRVGDLPTSKPLRTWLAGLDALQIAFDPENAWQDPAGSVGTIVGADPRRRSRRCEAAAAQAQGHVLARRLARGRPGGGAGDRLGRRARGLNEPRVAAELGSLLPDDATLVVASSMPVRDVETFFPAATTPFRCSPTAARTGSTGRSPPRSASPRPGAGRSCC